MLNRFILFAAVCVLLFGCSSDSRDEAAKQPPPMKQEAAPAPAPAAPEPGEAAEERHSYSVEISPKEPTRTARIGIKATGFDPYLARIVWMVNGKPVSAYEPTSFVPVDQQAVAGDEIQAKAILENAEVLSNIVRVRNALPELTRVKIMPEVFGPGDSVYVEAEAEDPDGDPVTIEYEWTRNGQPAGTDREIGAPLSRGDYFTVRIMPFDGREYGKYVFLERQLANLPPMFAEDYSFTFDGRTYTYQARATDPDGDTVAYALKSAPEGMKIDPASGVVTWTVPSEQQGTTTYTIVAEDGRGGKSEIILNFKLSTGQQTESPSTGAGQAEEQQK